MRIVFVGNKDRGALCLRALVRAGANVVGVVTQPNDDPHKFWLRSVADVAGQFALPVVTTDNVDDNADDIRNWRPDLIVLCGYSRIVGAGVLGIPTCGTVNLHAGKLPDYRGGSPLNWAIINGETSITCTIHYATERVDAGAILAEYEVSVSPDDTIADVRQKTFDAFPTMLVEVVHGIETGTVARASFNPDAGTCYVSRRPQDGRIDWHHMTARQVYDFVRALTRPYPGAFTHYRGDKWQVWSTSPVRTTVKHTPGRICFASAGGMLVMARDRCVRIETVQRDGMDEAVSATDVWQSGEYLE